MHRMAIGWLLAVALTVETDPKIHAADAAHHQEVAPVLARQTALARSLSGTSSHARDGRVVYAYFPYWAPDTSSVPWEHLTHLAYFAVDVAADGTLGDARGWDTAGGAALVAAGHAAGVKVTLTAALFDNAAIEALLLDATAQNQLIGSLVALVAAASGDGVNIDFEMVPPAVKNEFVAFMTELTQQFHAAIPGSHVSLASPAVDWTGAYDYDLLAANTDGLLIMGYGYHWSGGPPGPVSPISAGATWQSRDLTATVVEYLTWGGSENRRHFILGFPLYGTHWPTLAANVPGTATGAGTSRRASDCETQFLSGKSWDTDSRTPYQVYQDAGGYRQLFCEDEASFAEKLDLAAAADFGGVMFWALSYLPADHPLWAQVDAYASAPPLPAVAVPAEACGCTSATGPSLLALLLLRRRRKVGG